MAKPLPSRVLTACGAALTLWLSGCNAPSNLTSAPTNGSEVAPGAKKTGAQDRKKVVTTFTILADMARNVAGDAILSAR